MTDLREEVMFYLEIQAAYQPGNNSVPGGKVGRSPDLMDGPFGTAISSSILSMLV
jgi:hypothetical protein